MSDVTVGMIVAAPFKGDKSWYRAEVTGVEERGHAQLLYLDFGDRGQVELSQLKQLRSDNNVAMCMILACAVQFTLVGLWCLCVGDSVFSLHVL